MISAPQDGCKALENAAKNVYFQYAIGDIGYIIYNRIIYECVILRQRYESDSKLSMKTYDLKIYTDKNFDMLQDIQEERIYKTTEDLKADIKVIECPKPKFEQVTI